MDDTTPRDLDDNGPVDLDRVADRLEAALARIGQGLEARSRETRSLDNSQAATHNTLTHNQAALAARLDGLIDRLRDALGREAAP